MHSIQAYTHAYVQTHIHTYQIACIHADTSLVSRCCIFFKAPPMFQSRMHVGLLGCLTMISCLCASLTTNAAPRTARESPSAAGDQRTSNQILRSTWYNVSNFAAVNMTSEEKYYFNVVCGHGHYDGEPRLRQEYRTLSDKQRRQLHDAFNRMRNTTVPGAGRRTEYEVFIGYHHFYRSPGAHFGPAFVLWHREYILR